MTADPVREGILALLARIAPEADLDAIDGETSIREQIDIDSMDALNILAGLADAFGIDVPETDYGRLQTLDAMVAYVRERKTGRSIRG